MSQQAKPTTLYLNYTICGGCWAEVLNLFPNGCDGEDCQGCEECPPEPQGTPIDQAIRELEREKQENMDKTEVELYKTWGYSEDMAQRLATDDTPLTQEELAAHFPDVDSTPPHYLEHVKDVVLKGDADRLPSLLNRSDGATLIYAGKLNSIFGRTLDRQVVDRVDSRRRGGADGRACPLVGF